MSNLNNYIDYYKTLVKPGYAVLVTGKWGTGKTYQVKKALRNDKYSVSYTHLTLPTTPYV